MPESRPTSDVGHLAYVFGGFTLDTDRGELLRDGQLIPLRPKSFAVLRCLVENCGRLLTRTELLDGAWGRKAVSDDCLSQCLVDIRKALDDTAHEMIRTVPCKGYIFELPVSEQEIVAAPLGAPPRRALSLERPIAGVIVLLASVGVLWLLLQQIPSEDRLLTDTPSEAASDAHAEVQLGQHFFRRRNAGDLAFAERHYRAALELDSSLAEAWAGLAAIAIVRVDEGDLAKAEGLRRADRALRRVLTLAPDMAEAHLRAATYYRLMGDSDNAAAHYETAARLEPDNPLVLTIAAGRAGWAGHFEKSVALWRAALRQEPGNAVTHWNLAYFLTAANRYEEAEEHLQRVAELRADSDGKVRIALALVKLLQGHAEVAREALESLPADLPDRDKGLAMAYHMLEMPAESEAALERLLASSAPARAARLAEVYAWRREIGPALAWLHRARRQLAAPEFFEPENTTAETIRFSPFLRPLREHPGWQDTLAFADR